MGCCYPFTTSYFWGALRDLAPFAQFKKREKHPWRSVNFKASTCNFTKINTPPRMFFTFFKFYKWYQIAQRTTYESFERNRYALGVFIDLSKDFDTVDHSVF